MSSSTVEQDFLETPSKASMEAVDGLAGHIRTSHFVLIAACFTLAALVVTAEPKRRHLQAQEDLEGIKRAIAAGTSLDPSPFVGGLNLSAKEFLESSPSDHVKPSDPFVEKDCVVPGLDDPLNLLAPHLLREDQQRLDLGVVVDNVEERAFFVHLPEGVQRWQGTPADLAAWFYMWDGLRDPVPALMLLPKSLRWFELGDLDPALSARIAQAFSMPQYEFSNEDLATVLGKIDLAAGIDDTEPLPTDVVAVTPPARCLGIHSDSFYLVQLKQISGDVWRAIFVLPEGGQGGPSGDSFVLERIAVFDTNLQRSSVELNWQGKVAEQAGTSWKPGRSVDSFPDLVELTQGLDSLRMGQVARFLENVERQAAASEGRVTVASIDLPAQLAATWGIGIVLILQLYLHLHVLRLKDLANGLQTPLSSWIGLYPGSFSRVVAALSICLPPFVCIVAIVTQAIRNDVPEGGLEQTGFYLAPFASLALGVLTAVAASTIGRARMAAAD